MLDELQGKFPRESLTASVHPFHLFCFFVFFVEVSFLVAPGGGGGGGGCGRMSVAVRCARY